MVWQTLDWLAQLLKLRSLARATGTALLFLAVYFVLTYALERMTAGRTSRYLRGDVLTDLAYFFYARIGVAYFLYSGALLMLIGSNVSVLRLNLLDGLPSPARWLIYLLAVDFGQYWWHRLQHSNRFLWAFHSTHHSEEHITFLTGTRIHPVEDFIQTAVLFFPLQLLAGRPVDWLPIVLLRDFQGTIQHSVIRWRFGPLYRVFVSPEFHLFHHSVHPEHHNRNFGATLSIWDFLFGTAVKQAERPTQLGLADIKMPTLRSSLLIPFRMMVNRN